MIEPTQVDGKRILVGITREHVSGKVSQEQFVGVARIEDGNDLCLIVIECADGETREYPFDNRALTKAAPGEYRLRSSGEIVNNPDYLMTWIVSEGKPEE
ncbi:MAG: hypothetical protein V4502_06670 [Pseudomonadota bacterium]